MRSTEHFIILEYPRVILVNLIEKERLCLWEDLYSALGLFPIFETYNLDVKNECDRFNYRLIRTSEGAVDDINELLKENLLKSNRKGIKFYNKEGRLKKFNWSAFYCAPYTHKDKTAHIYGLEVWIPKHFIPETELEDMITKA